MRKKRCWQKLKASRYCDIVGQFQPDKAKHYKRTNRSRTCMGEREGEGMPPRI